MATKKNAGKKAPDRKPAPKPAARRRNDAPAASGGAKPAIAVRMYRQGLGDCFLLTCDGGTGRPFYMLIDCGVVLGTPQPESRMGQVLDDILSVTGGRIDVLAVTHEHWDHVSGFAQARDRFDRLAIGEVWLAWTEDLSDPLARKLRDERRAAENALRMAAAHLAVAGDGETAQRVDTIVSSFFGAAGGSTEDALAYAKQRAPSGKPRYCHPGEPPIALPDAPGIHFWILGPPRDEKLIKKSNPSQGTAYGLDAGPGGSQALLMAGLTRNLGAAPGEPAADGNLEDPFDDAYGIPMPRAEHVPFFEQRYFGESSDGSLYDRSAGQEIRDQSWRRIDSQWMGAAETMALQLDSATNNTSLVLAIERTATGEVLLFPGDAQAGSWLSWQDVKWQPGDTGMQKPVTGPDLLARTILYKVGHHGSHNATLKAQGLELMVSDGLMAMIPVDHAMAVKKRWGRMPLPELVDRIREKSHGRVLSIDDAVSGSGDLAILKPADVPAADWQAFTRKVRVTDLYYEILC